MISAIVAIDENWGIGFNGELLEKIPEDMKQFRLLTHKRTILMGRKTWDSLPKKPLPDRLNLVITREERKFDNMTVFINMEEAKVRAKEAAKNHNDEWFIIGGGQIYKELLFLCDRVYVTKIFKSHNNVDTYFPTLEQKEWEITHQSEILTFNDLQYQFLTYDRIN